jgi:predicted phage terminase large subunit-like protein
MDLTPAAMGAAQFLKRTVLDNPYTPHKPHPPQAKFLVLPHKEILYGGAAGGGKSDALLMAALQFCQVPGYSALLLRRTFADLSKPGALIPRSKEWLSPTNARYNEQTHSWTFPNGGVLSFGYLQYSSDIYQYQSAEYQFIGFDELTQFEENQYRYLFSRLRRLQGVTLPLRVRGASNPGGIGHSWVKKRFIDTPSRVFISSKLEDNPSLDRAEYEESLAELDPLTRRQLRHGDWGARPAGEIINSKWFEIVEPSEAPWKGVPKVRYYDFAATEVRGGIALKARKKNNPDYTAGALVGDATEIDGYIYVYHIDYYRETPMVTEVNVKRRARKDGQSIPIWMEEEGGASGKQAMHNWRAKVLPEYQVHSDRKTGSKMTRWGIFSSKAEASIVRLVAGPWVDFFCDQCDALTVDNTHDHDDCIDAVSGAWVALAGKGEFYASWMGGAVPDPDANEPADPNQDDNGFYMTQ